VGAGEVSGNEVAMKIFGILLTAMAEKNGIYWVASANKISHIQQTHPEFLRKGRFDNIWYVPLPDLRTRATIFGIHCRLNNIDINDLDIDKIVNNMTNWSGAEIEHVCKEASINSIAESEKITTQSILEQMKSIKGVSKGVELNKELEQWANDMAINVNK